MVNKILQFSLKPDLTIRNCKASWKAVADSIMQAIEFREPMSKDPSPARHNRVIFYTQCDCLDFANVFILLMHKILTEHQVDGELKEYPEFFYNFFSEMPLPSGKEEGVNGTTIDQFRKNLTVYLNGQDPLRDQYWTMLKTGMKTRSFFEQRFHVLRSYEKIQAVIKVPAEGLMSLFIALFEHFKLTLATIESRYNAYFPEMLKGKDRFAHYMDDWEKSKDQLGLMKRALTNIHQLLTKKEGRTSKAIFQEITNPLLKLIDDKNLLGMFGADILDGHKTIVASGYLMKIDMSDPLIKYVELEQLVNPTLNFLQWVRDGITYKELEAVVHYQEESNRIYQRIMNMLIYPITDFVQLLGSFSELSCSQFRNLLVAERPPLFTFPKGEVPPISLEDLILEDKKSPSVPKKLSSKSGESLYLKTRKMLPHLTRCAPNGPLLQSVIYLEDLEAITHLPHSALKAAMAWSTCHKLIEQTYRLYHFNRTQQDVREHNLVKLTGKETPVILDLFNANRWVGYTFETYFNRLRKNQPIPHVLQSMFDILTSTPQLDMKTLGDGVLETCQSFLEGSPGYEVKSPVQQLNLELTFVPLPLQPLNTLLSQFHPNSTPFLKLREVQKEHRLLQELEGVLQNPITNRQLPLLTRYMAKLHHSILEHLMIAVYAVNRYEYIREHRLINLTKEITNLTESNIVQITTDFPSLHRLSNYPFDTSKEESPWHRAIVIAELIRSEPLTEQEISLGGVSVKKQQICLEPIKSVMQKSRALLSDCIPRLLENLTLEIS